MWCALRHLLCAVDYDRKAVVVEYEQESSLMDEYGEVLRVERKPHRKLYVPAAPCLDYHHLDELTSPPCHV